MTDDLEANPLDILVINDGSADLIRLLRDAGAKMSGEMYETVQQVLDTQSATTKRNFQLVETYRPKKKKRSISISSSEEALTSNKPQSSKSEEKKKGEYSICRTSGIGKKRDSFSSSSQGKKKN